VETVSLRPETRYSWRKKNLEDLKERLNKKYFDVKLTVATRDWPILPLLKVKATSYFLTVNTGNLNVIFTDYKADFLIGNILEEKDKKLYEFSKQEYPHRLGIDFAPLKKIIGKHKV